MTEKITEAILELEKEHSDLVKKLGVIEQAIIKLKETKEILKFNKVDWPQAIDVKIIKKRTEINSKLFCPNCKSKKIVKQGFNKKEKGTAQRYTCKECGKRFIERKMDYRMKYPQETINKVISLYKAGTGIIEISQKLNICKESVYDWLKKAKVLDHQKEEKEIDLNDDWKKVEKYANPKTTWIKENAEENTTIKELCDKYEEKFGESRTVNAMNNTLWRFKLPFKKEKNGRPKEKEEKKLFTKQPIIDKLKGLPKEPRRKKSNSEVNEFIRNNKNVDTLSLRNRISEKFGIFLSQEQIKYRMNDHGSGRKYPEKKETKETLNTIKPNNNMDELDEEVEDLSEIEIDDEELE